MLSLKASAFSDPYPHHWEATIHPTFCIQHDPYAEPYSDSNLCLDSCVLADFLQLFKDLDLMGKYFLLRFSIFPANTVVDKRTVTYWCIGMGVLHPLESQIERVANKILEKLVVKGFVEAKKQNFKFVGEEIQATGIFRN